MKTISLTKLSPYAILTAVFGLSLSLFLLVMLFQPQLHMTLKAPPYLVFHNIIEFFSVMVSLSIFGVGWFAFNQSRNRYALFLSAAFLAVSLIDFMHALSFPGMPDFITPSSTNKGILFWIAARTVSACAFIVSAYIYPETPNHWLSKKNLLIVAFAISGLVFISDIYYPAYLPVMFIEGIGLTPAKIYSECLIVGLFALSFVVYWKRLSKTGDRIFILYLAALIMCIFSELAFTLYKSAYDTYNMLGHIYKLVAFFLIYLGMFEISIQYPYIKLLETSEKLRGEIAERKRAEVRLHNLTRLYATLSQVNQTIVRVKQKEELLQKICSVVVDVGQFTTAWVGLVDESGGKVNPVTYAGDEARYRQYVDGHIDNKLNTAINSALSTGKVIICQNVQTDQPRQSDSVFSNCSFAVIPFSVKGKAIGYLNLYAAEPDFFIKGELGLLEEISIDISFVLDTMEVERESELAEKTLKEQYLTLHSIIDNSNALVFSVDRQYRYTSFNKEHAAVMKVIYGADIEKGRSLLDYMTVTEDRETAKGNLDRALAGEQLVEESYSGEELRSRQYFQVSHSPITTETGEVIGVAVLAYDLTERKQVEKALHKSEADLKEAQRVGRLGSWDWDAITDTITWSKEYYRIYGFDPAQRPPGYEEHLKAYTPESAARLDAAVKRNLQTGEPYEIDLELADPKGPCRWVTARSETKLDARGKVTGLRGTAQDISERKKAEEALRESEGRYRTLIENINLGVCLIDKDYKFVTTNRAFDKMFGVTKEDVIDKHCFEVCAKSSLVCLHCPGTESMAFKKAVRIESECVCTDGTRLPVILHTYPVFDTNNEAIAFIKISEDITEYKKVEQAKKNLIRDMSHTLKTPIAMTEMAFDIIKKSIDSGDKESIEKANKIASENLEKLRKDITNILQEFSMDVHKDIIGKKDKNASINAVMSGITNNLKMLLERKGLQLEINIPVDADRIKMEDRDIKTILNNLLDNAVKFTDNGTISVISRLKGEMVEIEVRDTGCGISVKDINRVFDKFYKRHAAIEGTGLGLSICKEMVEMYKGEINIYSEGAGKGTAVVVSLPKV
ncbi:MAG: MASE3 domain-containing protein [bacterium]|nr:MASE3 domain-containing protein [bacterium]